MIVYSCAFIDFLRSELIASKLSNGTSDKLGPTNFKFVAGLSIDLET